MKLIRVSRFLSVAVVAGLSFWHAYGGLDEAADAQRSDDGTRVAPAGTSDDAAASPADVRKGLDAVMAADKDSTPTDTFPADLPKVYAFWIAHGLENGDKVRGVWVVDDVGDVAPKGSKIDESTLVYSGVNENAFDLSKPTAGWPVGKYHVDLYINDDLAKTVAFHIVAAQ